MDRATHALSSRRRPVPKIPNAACCAMPERRIHQQHPPRRMDPAFAETTAAQEEDRAPSSGHSCEHDILSWKLELHFLHRII
ncbi:hypothetical protein [Bradyrhizobium acaciae]|uniref:hypothetical protein n=1 Tax=Bradyrhizobium acaciae TaxID=2683706 RepID=UPI001E298FA9|nr:hypothetical protein [Bradyrhizobium acaciae]MCC8981383.1 hypothetical protein [Bradyrhizobium acaciae]